ncbi:MAG TPA: hypothetical protein VKU00_25695 [Chthonomonadaceae bacterium]|nr:hypothetical protein [Chthonomonadaceae bacterium]
MSKMPTDRNRFHEDLLRRVGISMPDPAKPKHEHSDRDDHDALDPLRSVLPPSYLPGPTKPRTPKKGR